MRNGVIALGLSILGATPAGLSSVSCSGGDPTTMPALPPRPADASSCPYWFAYIDADGDGFGASVDTGVVCQNGVLPEGYVSVGGDCDDSNPELNTWYYADADSDGYAGAEAEKICGPKDRPPPNSVSLLYTPGDCDDSDPTLRTLYYQDADGDGWAASDAVSTCGSPSQPPPGFGIYITSLHDCDDTRADVSPDGLELWDDNIDSDCDGAPTPHECPTELCGPGMSTVPTDATCATFDLAVTSAYASTECFKTEWYVTIANHGNELASGHELRIEVSGRTLVFKPLDAIRPGQAYTYLLASHWNLAGAVRFVAVSQVPDCRPDNDTLAAVEYPLDCSF